ncbi:hypothetical protein [Micromonospora sp. KC213]|uniref:hypothetical protein n=1 Tax=Micromonospora sp. KC213 TaxID=2530378 RepID=UPI0010491A85|nr:hypothetical protein [Micromonospora sp. KC213]TDC29975.1 hypothetical protein E1166_29400 [Micromonospora sp. KC213]
MTIGERRFDGLTFGGNFTKAGTLRVAPEYGRWYDLDRADVVALRDHLTAVLGDGPKPAPAEAPAIEVGREYRLLPQATYRMRGGTPVAAGVSTTGATRVRVDNGPDREGDVMVTALDGTDAGNPGWYVDPAFLAPLDAAPAVPDVAQAAREVATMYAKAAGRAYGPHTNLYRHIGEAFATFADKLEGKPDA